MANKAAADGVCSYSSSPVQKPVVIFEQRPHILLLWSKLSLYFVSGSFSGLKNLGDVFLSHAVSVKEAGFFGSGAGGST